jgi:RimJ/RimL family protein N-acetyltransferase
MNPISPHLNAPASPDRSLDLEFPVDLRLRDGTPALIWPLLSTDGPGLQLAWEKLSARSRESRFLTPRQELGPDMLKLLVGDVDQRRHLAFVLIALPPGGPDAVVGIGRLVQDEHDPAVADIAVTVDDDWQGRGIGALLVDALVRHRPTSVNRLVTVVAVDNKACLAMLRRLGAMTLANSYPGVFEVRVELETVPHPREGSSSPSVDTSHTSSPPTTGTMGPSNRPIGRT